MTLTITTILGSYCKINITLVYPQRTMRVDWNYSWCVTKRLILTKYWKSLDTSEVFSNLPKLNANISWYLFIHSLDKLWLATYYACALYLMMGIKWGQWLNKQSAELKWSMMSSLIGPFTLCVALSTTLNVFWASLIYNATVKLKWIIISERFLKTATSGQMTSFSKPIMGHKPADQDK